jgi:hypothetical protein
MFHIAENIEHVAFGEFFGEFGLQPDHLARHFSALAASENQFPLRRNAELPSVGRHALINLSPDPGQLGLEVFDQRLPRRGPPYLAAVLGHQWLTRFPGQELLPVVGKLLGADDAEVPGFEFGGDMSKDTDFQLRLL